MSHAKEGSTVQTEEELEGLKKVQNEQGEMTAGGEPHN